MTVTGWTTNLGGGMPWAPVEARLDSCQQSVTRLSDAAALVEAVRECHDQKKHPPTWVLDELEKLLAEFVVLVTPPKLRPRVRRPLYKPWGRIYVKAACDWAIADHLETSRRVYGLTEEEALDEASCHFRGTSLAGSPDRLKKAWQRARRRSLSGWFQRAPTRWESRVLYPLLDPPVVGNSVRSYWRIVNADRQGDRRGEWSQRPRRLAQLSPAALEEKAQRVIQGWHREWDR